MVKAQQVKSHGVHAGPGGARMDSPRMKVCTMFMAWPQCRQMKAGGAAAFSAAFVWLMTGGPCAGSTCNNSRASARLILGAPLANKP